MAIGEEWKVFDYERDMGEGLWAQLASAAYDSLPWALKNAAVESLVLHTRNLCDILTSKEAKGKTDDILLKNLLPSFTSPHISALEAVYGKGNDRGTPCWQFNKLMMHSTSERSDSQSTFPH